MNLAVVECPRCPSDAADWEGIFTESVLAADCFTCRVCDTQWIVWR